MNALIRLALVLTLGASPVAYAASAPSCDDSVSCCPKDVCQCELKADSRELEGIIFSSTQLSPLTGYGAPQFSVLDAAGLSAHAPASVHSPPPLNDLHILYSVYRI